TGAGQALVGGEGPRRVRRAAHRRGVADLGLRGQPARRRQLLLLQPRGLGAERAARRHAGPHAEHLAQPGLWRLLRLRAGGGGCRGHHGGAGTVAVGRRRPGADRHRGGRDVHRPVRPAGPGRRLRGRQQRQAPRGPARPALVDRLHTPGRRVMGSSGWVLPEEVLAGAPTHTPRPGELADLELILSGAFAPLTGLLTSADLASMSRRGRLADGTPWSVPVTLEVPTDLIAGMDLGDPLHRALVVTDFEGTPVAAVDVVDAWPTRDGMTGVGGPVRRINDPFPGPFAALRRPPAAVRERLPDGRVLGVVADAPLHRPQLAQIVLATRTLQAHPLVLIPVAEPTAAGLPPEALVRCVLAARDRMPAATIVTVP